MGERSPSGRSASSVAVSSEGPFVLFRHNLRRLVATGVSDSRVWIPFVVVMIGFLRFGKRLAFPLW